MPFALFRRILHSLIYNKLMNYLENIYKIRKERKLSQKKVTEYLGISQRFYSDLENGDRHMKVEYVIALARLYKISIDELLGFTLED